MLTEAAVLLSNACRSRVRQQKSINRLILLSSKLSLRKLQDEEGVYLWTFPATVAANEYASITPGPHLSWRRWPRPDAAAEDLGYKPCSHLPGT